MEKIDKNTKTIMLFLAGIEIERRDNCKEWLKKKDKHLECIEKGIMMRRTAIKAYTEVRNFLVYKRKKQS